jgi:hypothetical protein
MERFIFRALPGDASAALGRAAEPPGSDNRRKRDWPKQEPETAAQLLRRRLQPGRRNPLAHVGPDFGLPSLSQQVISGWPGRQFFGFFA